MQLLSKFLTIKTINEVIFLRLFSVTLLVLLCLKSDRVMPVVISQLPEHRGVLPVSIVSEDSAELMRLRRMAAQAYRVQIAAKEPGCRKCDEQKKKRVTPEPENVRTFLPVSESKTSNQSAQEMNGLQKVGLTVAEPADRNPEVSDD